MNQSRRAVLGLVTTSIVGISGCSAVDDIARGVAKGGDEAAKGADEGASGGKGASGAAGADDVAEYSEGTVPPELETTEGPEPFETGNVEDFLPVYSIDQTLEVEPYGYRYYDIDLSSEMDDATLPLYIEYEVIVRSGPPIDVILTTQDEFEAYQNGDRFRYLSGSSLDTTLGTEAGSIDDIRTYYLILDSTTAGRASPDGYTTQTAEVDIDLTISDDQ